MRTVPYTAYVFFQGAYEFEITLHHRFLYLYLLLSIYLCISLYSYLYMHISLCISLIIYLFMHISICISLYVYLFMHISLWISLYAYLFMHISLCISLVFRLPYITQYTSNIYISSGYRTKT